MMQALFILYIILQVSITKMVVFVTAALSSINSVIEHCLIIETWSLFLRRV